MTVKGLLPLEIETMGNLGNPDKEIARIPETCRTPKIFPSCVFYPNQKAWIPTSHEGEAPSEGESSPLSCPQ